ncbi:MAG: hypothetical protein ACOH2D_01720 [Gelidibacter sp.]
MSEVNFGLTMKTAWKGFLLGKDYTDYRRFEKVHHSFEDIRVRLYKYNYRLFVLLVFAGFFFSMSFKILIFSLLWYKPVCHALHLKNRVKRFNIEKFKSYKGLE